MIDFIHNVENPKSNAIEIHPSMPAPSPTPGSDFTKFIDAGGSQYINPNGNVWEADTLFINLGST